MPITLTHKELQEARRLGKCLDSDYIPLKEMKGFFGGLLRRADQSAAVVRRESKKESRKQHYRMKLRTV